MDRNEKVWAYSNTGTKAHAFVQVWKDKDGNESTQHLRALCRGTIARHKDSIFASKDTLQIRCPNCEKKFDAMHDRAEASMAPVNPYDQVCEGIEPEVAPELPAGTRVAYGKVTGTVSYGERGCVTAPNHPNYGLTYVTVLLDRKDGLKLPRRLFVEELTNMDALHAEALEMDAEETAKAQDAWDDHENSHVEYLADKLTAKAEAETLPRWRYEGYRRDAITGYALSRISGYVNASSGHRARYALDAMFEERGVRLDVLVTPA
jgi:hypothetical protein